MGLGPPEAVRGPRAVPPTISLLTSVFPPEENVGNWPVSFRYEPDICGGGGTTDPCTGEDVDGNLPEPDDQDGAFPADGKVYEPFTIWHAYKCTPWPNQAEDWHSKALRSLEAITAYEIEKELWTGALNDAIFGVDAANPRLASASATVLATGLPTTALGELEQAYGTCSKGEIGMIHAPLSISNAWQEKGLLRREGNRLYTHRDNIVVPGAGYPGTGPAGQARTRAATWAFITPLVYALTTPSEVPTTLPEEFDRNSNTRTTWARRIAAAYYRPCCVYAIPVDVSAL